MAKRRKRSDVAQMNLRLSEPLRKMIEIEARKNGWSLNREMVRRLEQSFVEDSNKFIRGQLDEMAALLRSLTQDIGV